MANFSPTFGAGFAGGGGGFGGGMPADMQALMQAKYGIQQQEANNQTYNAQTQRTVGQAEAGYKVAQTGEVAANALAQRTLQGQQVSESKAKIANEGFARLFAPQEYYDKSRLQNSQAGLADAQVRNIDDDLKSSAIRRSQLVGVNSGKPSLFEQMATGAAQKGLDLWRGMTTSNPVAAPTPISVNNYTAPSQNYGRSRDLTPLYEMASPPPQKSSIAGYAPDRPPTFGWLGTDIAPPRFNQGAP